MQTEFLNLSAEEADRIASLFGDERDHLYLYLGGGHEILRTYIQGGTRPKIFLIPDGDVLYLTPGVLYSPETGTYAGFFTLRISGDDIAQFEKMEVRKPENAPPPLADFNEVFALADVDGRELLQTTTPTARKWNAGQVKEIRKVIQHYFPTSTFYSFSGIECYISVHENEGGFATIDQLSPFSASITEMRKAELDRGRWRFGFIDNNGNIKLFAQGKTIVTGRIAARAMFIRLVANMSRIILAAELRRPPRLFAQYDIVNMR